MIAALKTMETRSLKTLWYSSTDVSKHQGRQLWCWSHSLNTKGRRFKVELIAYYTLSFSASCQLLFALPPYNPHACSSDIFGQCPLFPNSDSSIRYTIYSRKSSNAQSLVPNKRFSYKTCAHHCVQCPHYSFQLPMQVLCIKCMDNDTPISALVVLVSFIAVIIGGIILLL